MASSGDQNTSDNMSHNRRSSVTSATLSSIFRSNSTSSAATGTPIFPGPITSAAIDQSRRRRLSLSTTAALGLSSGSGGGGSGSLSAGPSGGTGPNSFAARRASMSTNSSTSDTAFDENAIEDDDAPGGASRTPNAPFARRMSFGAQAMRNLRGPGGTSPGGASSNDQGYNWPEQLRSRAESSVTSGSRPSFASGMGNSPPRASGFAGMAGHATSGGGGVGNGGGVGMARHDRAKSVSDVPTPAPVQPRPAPQPRRETRPKPDHFQERILKGDFYMD
ncbi:MAG: hypothetical protein STHCBS139747_001375 [Sporothrix thermara]